ncbi:unnamed protein product, partial [Callosobruchus maculatus]
QPPSGSGSQSPANARRPQNHAIFSLRCHRLIDLSLHSALVTCDRSRVNLILTPILAIE